MKITIENTTKIVTLQTEDGGTMPARVWQGETDTGIPVQVFVTRIAPEIKRSHSEIDTLTAQFDAELQACATPRSSVTGIPLHLIL